MSSGYAYANLLTDLAASSFTWSSGYTTGRDRLNDGALDTLAASAASAQASGQTLAWDLGGALPVVGVALLNHNCAFTNTTVLVQAADNAAFTVNLVTAKAASTISGNEPNHKDAVFQFPSVSKRYWRLTFVHSGTRIITLGEVQALGEILTLSRTTIYGAGESERYVVNRNESATGKIRSTFVGGPIRRKTLPFKDLSTTDRDELLSMWRVTLGGNQDLLWIETIESTAIAATLASRECIWGRLGQTIDWTQDDYRLFNLGGFEIVGQGREVGS